MISTDELIRRISWRATRCAMDGEWKAHDELVGALNDLNEALGRARDPQCNCRRAFSPSYVHLVSAGGKR